MLHAFVRRGGVPAIRHGNQLHALDAGKGINQAVLVIEEILEMVFRVSGARYFRSGGDELHVLFHQGSGRIIFELPWRPVLDDQGHAPGFAQFFFGPRFLVARGDFGINALVFVEVAVDGGRTGPAMRGAAAPPKCCPCPSRRRL